MLRLCLFCIFLYSALALDCTQIPDSEIFAGNTVNLPGNYSTPQTIPANFNCIYRITVPVNSTSGLYAIVTLYNGLKGVNDQITVIEQSGLTEILNNRSGLGGSPKRYIVIPGASMTIQVITKSVFMDSRVLISISYCNANIGATRPLKTGGEMNYFDINTTRDGKNLFSSATFTSVEPIVMTQSVNNGSDGIYDCWDCFVIDGTFENQTQVYRWTYLNGQLFTTKSNAITVVSFYDGFFGIVFNPVSETKQFDYLESVAITRLVPSFSMWTSDMLFKEVYEIVNFDTTGLALTELYMITPTCKAYIVSGPPNNSSKVLLDLSTKPKLPYSFDLKYFTVVSENCQLQFKVVSFDD